MPFAGGGGGGQTPPATFSQGGNPAPYVPSNPYYADTQYQSLVNNLYGPARGSLDALMSSTGGAGAAGWAYPYAQNFAYNIGANPYAQEAIGGAEYLSQNFAPLLSSYGPGLLRSGQSLLDAGGAELGVAPQLISAGFDPQDALRQQLENRTSQGAAAANAAAGVSGPYAASTADEAMKNFNIAWENQRLQRELAGAQGAGAALGAGGNAISQGTNIIGQAAPLEQAALALKTAPGQLYGAQQSAGLNALAPAVNIGEGTFNEANSVLSALANYLTLGRNASLASGQLGSLGFNQGAQSAQGLGALAGLGSNFVFGNQGLSGALGLGEGGLIGPGGLAGLFGNAATDFAGTGAAGFTGGIDAGTAALDALSAVFI